MKHTKDQPATQRDLELWGGQLQNQMGEIREDVSDLKKDVGGLKKDVGGLKEDVHELKQGQSSLEKGQNSLERGLKALLTVTEENNVLLKELRRLPERVERLERAVFRK